MVQLSMIFLRQTIVALLLEAFITKAFFNLKCVHQADALQLLLPTTKPPVTVGSTSDSIILFVEMNPFDPQHHSQLDAPDHYEFQILIDCDEFSGWTNLSLKSVASVGNGFPISVTITHLTANTCYRFRTRAVFQKDASSWSFASADIYTKSTIPLKIINLETISVDTNSVTVAWNVSQEQKNVSRDREGLIDTCFLQYSLVSSNEKLEGPSPPNWVNLNKHISMIAEPDIAEIQEVTTLVDSASQITTGFFWLKLQIPQSKPIKRSNIVSAPIAYNSTAEGFERAISHIDGVVKVRVFQSYEDSLGISLLSGRGSFTWRVEFLDMSEVFIPLLELHRENLDGTYIPDRPRVRIERLQTGSCAKYRSSAQVNVADLEPSTSYSFRVACKNKYGISDWSLPIYDVMTKDEIPSLTVEDSDRAFKKPDCIDIARNANIRLSNLHHDSVIVLWTVIQSGTVASDVTGYEIELSTGREGSANEGGQCSDDFKVVDLKAVNFTNSDMSTKIASLRDETPYCIRLIAYCRDGSAELGQSVEFSTKRMPSNCWFRLDNYDDSIHPERFQQLRSFNDQYSFCDIPKRPASRRGHSLTLLNDNIYLFGGLGSICRCKTNYSESCSFSTMYANDLWSFNTMTRTWKLLHLPTDDLLHPIGREQYSATRLQNGKIVYIGGRTSPSLNPSDKTKLYLGDVWALDPGQVRKHKFHASSIGNMPKSFVDGNILYDSMLLAVNADEGSRESELCVKAMTVQIIFEHSCIEEVKRISLVGPRNGLNYSDESSRGSMKDIILFTSSNHYASSKEMKCSYHRINITFSDDADKRIQDYSYRLPESGFFQPAEPINSQLYGSAVKGAWTLELIDTRINKKTGTLLEWVLNVDTQYCTDGYKWILLHPSNHRTYGNTNSMETEQRINKNSAETGYGEDNGIIFKPRYRHAAMAVGNHVFVMGGRADEIYFDILRFDYETRRWTLLRGVDHVYPRRDQSVVLTPLGLFTLNGLDEFMERKTVQILRYDVMSRSWSNITQDISTQDIPEWRYLTALCYVGNNHLFISPHSLRSNVTDIYSLLSPTIIMLGGDADLPNYRYLSDIWAFSMEDIAEGIMMQGYPEQKQKFCANLLSHDKAYDPWEWSCGIFGGRNSERFCDWIAITERSWCLNF